MSIPGKTLIPCPECGQQYEAFVFASLNTDFAPDIPQSIINGERFNARCPNCGFIAHLEYDLLYNDLVHSAMIWVVHPNQNAYSKKLDEVRSTNLLVPHKTRTVADMNELREKVSCLESNLDDRVVELCKIFLESQVHKQHPDFVLRKTFYSFLDGKRIIFFYDENGNEMECELTDDTYSMIEDSFAPILDQDSDTPFQIIDHNWAVSWFDYKSTLAPKTSLAENVETTVDLAVDHVVPDGSNFVPDYPTNQENQTKPPVKFCRRCGAKLIQDSLFCSYCGTEVIFDVVIN